MDEKEIDYMNVIPLVDVMLVLLTIVLMASTFIATGSIAVNLPQTSTKQEDVLKVQTVEIDRSGKLYFNAQPISLAGLEEMMKPLERSIPVLIRADRDLALQVFVDVIERIKNLGFSRVSLQTEQRL